MKQFLLLESLFCKLVLTVLGLQGIGVHPEEDEGPGIYLHTMTRPLVIAADRPLKL
jgi:hypothetical protein